MKVTTTLTTIAVLTTAASALVENAPAAAHKAALGRRNHALGQMIAPPVDESELQRRGFELVKRKETVAEKKKAKARAVAAAAKSKALKLAKASSSKSKASSKAKAAAASKSKASASKSKASSLKKYSSSSKKAASSLKKYSSSSKKAASATKKTTTTKKATTTSSKKTSTTTTKAAATAKATTTSQKKGLGYNTASFTTAFGNSLAWAYNWANAPGGTIPSTAEFVPMLWGSDASGWSAAATSAIASGSSHLLGFNEPDATFAVGGSNIAPATAAALWKTNMEPFAGKATLVSPAITNGGSPMGITWMNEFLGNCSACTVDAIAMHWYDTATNVAYFENYFNDAAVTFAGKKIWVTEFMGSGTVAQQETFLQTVIPYLEGKTEIARYAAFGDFAGTFVDSSGALTALGTVYKNTV